MADVSDLKSEARKSVWVRVPPPAPYKLQGVFGLCHPLVHRVTGQEGSDRADDQNGT